jgi:hypothetical protein
MSIVSGTTYAISFFIKEGSYNNVSIPFQGSKMNATISIDFDAETASASGSDVVSGTEFMEPYANGWYRVGFNGTPDADGNMDMYVAIGPNGVSGYTGDGVSYTDFYGFQCEAASYATSYIPNHGESGGVTRAADSCSVTGASDVIGGTSGTIFFDVVMNESLTNTNYKQFFYYTDSGANQTYMYVSDTNYIVGNPNLGNIISSTQLQAGERYKIAVTYATNSFKMYINGSEDATSSSGTPKDNENIISIGSYSGLSEFNEFGFKQYAHFQEVLSDAELATLTTL